MQGRVTVFWVVVAVGCGHDAGRVDTAGDFLGQWVCDAGTRELDCEGAVSTVDLASGFPDVLRFSRGETSDLLLTLPSRALVPGLPEGPSCELEFNSPNGDDALLVAAPTCVDDNGQNIVVHDGSARLGWTLLYVTTRVSANTGCRIDNQARCWRSGSETDEAP